MKRLRSTYKCPDCGQRLYKRKAKSRLQCNNPRCPVIHVTFTQGRHPGRATRIARAAIPRILI